MIELSTCAWIKCHKCWWNRHSQQYVDETRGQCMSAHGRCMSVPWLIDQWVKVHSCIVHAHSCIVHASHISTASCASCHTYDWVMSRNRDVSHTSMKHTHQWNTHINETHTLNTYQWVTVTVNESWCTHAGKLRQSTNISRWNWHNEHISMSHGTLMHHRTKPVTHSSKFQQNKTEKQRLLSVADIHRLWITTDFRKVYARLLMKSCVTVFLALTSSCRTEIRCVCVCERERANVWESETWIFFYLKCYLLKCCVLKCYVLKC